MNPLTRTVTSQEIIALRQTGTEARKKLLDIETEMAATQGSVNRLQTRVRTMREELRITRARATTTAGLLEKALKLLKRRQDDETKAETLDQAAKDRARERKEEAERARDDARDNDNKAQAQRNALETEEDGLPSGTVERAVPHGRLELWNVLYRTGFTIGTKDPKAPSKDTKPQVSAPSPLVFFDDIKVFVDKQILNDTNPLPPYWKTESEFVTRAGETVRPRPGYGDFARLAYTFGGTISELSKYTQKDDTISELSKYTQKDDTISELSKYTEKDGTSDPTLSETLDALESVVSINKGTLRALQVYTTDETNARIAAADQMLKEMLIAVEDDMERHFVFPMLDTLRRRLKDDRLNVGIVQRTELLVSNRLLARVDPRASAQLEVGKTTNALEMTQQLAQLYAAASTGGALGSLGLLDTFKRDDPVGVYGITTGNVFQVTPVIDPSGQALRFRFDYTTSNTIREPDGSVNPSLPRVDRHTVNTEVQLSSLELRNISRYDSNTQIGLPIKRTGGIPLFKELPLIRDIPVLGYFTRRSGRSGAINHSLIFAQSTVYPTIGALIPLLSGRNTDEDGESTGGQFGVAMGGGSKIGIKPTYLLEIEKQSKANKTNKK